MSSCFPYRLALDLGATSIGWAVFRINGSADMESVQPEGLIKAGVRIFSDGRNPKDKTSLAVARRLARQQRRRRDRLLKRKNRLVQTLIEEGFFPADLDERHALAHLDPYELRKKGLDAALTPAEFGRVLFHLNQRRGFKSNRKTDKKDNESGALKSAIKRVHALLDETGARTVGEWLANRHARRESVRARLREERTVKEDGKVRKENRYDLYIDRAMTAHEFDTLWQYQAAFNPTVFQVRAKARLRDTLLFQRPLKPVEPGRCTLLPEEPRAPLAHPLTQRFRIYQEVNNLRLLDTQQMEVLLTIEQRNTVVRLLETKGDQSFPALRKALRLAGDSHFNLEDGKRDRLKGNATSRILAKKEHFDARWYNFSDTLQAIVVEKLLEVEESGVLIEWLQEQTGCDEASAQRLVEVQLPEGYGNLSLKALQVIVPKLQEGIVLYHEAVRSAGFASHSALSHTEQTGEIMPFLPYYGEPLQRHVGFGTGNLDDLPEKRFGRIANPTVHIGLNQVRAVVNALIKRYGLPSQVVIEVARELKMGREQREKIQKEQASRQKQNERWREEIRPLIGDGEPRREDLQKMRLWTELSKDLADRKCPYTGEQISLAMLFSNAVEIEHILPFAQTLDDSLNNKTVCRLWSLAGCVRLRRHPATDGAHAQGKGQTVCPRRPGTLAAGRQGFPGSSSQRYGLSLPHCQGIPLAHLPAQSGLGAARPADRYAAREIWPEPVTCRFGGKKPQRSPPPRH